MDIKQGILEALEAIGVILDENVENISLSEIIEDSIAFMSFIVELEDKFSIEIPDDWLAADRLATLADVEMLISAIINDQLK